MQIEWGKLGTLAAVIVSATVLALAGVVSGEFVGAVLFTVMGYVIGNGRLAVAGKTPVPMIARRPPEPPAPELETSNTEDT